jgi:hypothetical protein
MSFEERPLSHQHGPAASRRSNVAQLRPHVRTPASAPPAWFTPLSSFALRPRCCLVVPGTTSRRPIHRRCERRSCRGCTWCTAQLTRPTDMGSPRQRSLVPYVEQRLRRPAPSQRRSCVPGSKPVLAFGESIAASVA